ncbi:hypothetical protein R75471_06232 [Paraburkholderia domus]|nr:hypothetical protein R75471_06232 [Paraburkholderia domus]
MEYCRINSVLWNDYLLADMPKERSFKCGRVAATTILAITLAAVTVTRALGEDAGVTQCVGPLSLRLADAALNAPRVANSDGTLYGLQRWRPGTNQTYLGVAFPGLLSCAYTVSAIFGAACHPIGALASVRQVDAALSGWKKISNLNELQPGDVIFWRPRKAKILGVSCPNTHWHVGISVGGDRTVDNDWWSGQPRLNRIARLCSDFAYARRPLR